MSEAQWQADVSKLAHLLGWRHVYHTHDSRRSAPGFPDLVLVRERVVFCELKTDTGKLSPAQRDWLTALYGAGAEVYVARPRQERELSRVLSHRADDRRLDPNRAVVRAAMGELRSELMAAIAPP